MKAETYIKNKATRTGNQFKKRTITSSRESELEGNIVNIHFTSPQNVSWKKEVITRKGYMKYQVIIQEKEISKIIENGEHQESYIWVYEAGNTIKLVHIRWYIL